MTCDTIADVTTYLNTTVEFFCFDSVQKGFVNSEKSDSLIVTITLGKNHGEVWEIHPSDVIDHTFDEYEVDDSRNYAWYNEE